MTVLPLAPHAPHIMARRDLPAHADIDDQAVSTDFREFLAERSVSAQDDGSSETHHIVQHEHMTHQGAPASNSLNTLGAENAASDEGGADLHAGLNPTTAERFEDVQLFRSLEPQDVSLGAERRFHIALQKDLAQDGAVHARNLPAAEQLDLQSRPSYAGDRAHAWAPRRANDKTPRPDRAAATSAARSPSTQPSQTSTYANFGTLIRKAHINASTSPAAPVFVAFHASDGAFSVLARAGRMAPTERTKLRHALGALLAEYGIFDAALSIDGEGDARWPK